MKSQHFFTFFFFVCVCDPDLSLLYEMTPLWLLRNVKMLLILIVCHEFDNCSHLMRKRTSGSNLFKGVEHVVVHLLLNTSTENEVKGDFKDKFQTPPLSQMT